MSSGKECGIAQPSLAKSAFGEGCTDGNFCLAVAEDWAFDREVATRRRATFADSNFGHRNSTRRLRWILAALSPAGKRLIDTLDNISVNYVYLEIYLTIVPVGVDKPLTIFPLGVDPMIDLGTYSATSQQLGREDSSVEQQGGQASNISVILRDFLQYDAARQKADALRAKASSLREQITKIETTWTKRGYLLAFYARLGELGKTVTAFTHSSCLTKAICIPA
jgi:hypothetical protein